MFKARAGCPQGVILARAGNLARPQKEGIPLLLAIGIVLLVIAIAGGAIVHPVLFALGLVALVLFFQR